MVVFASTSFRAPSPAAGLTALFPADSTGAASVFRVSESHPGYSNAHYGLGYVFMQSGRIDEAIEAFRATLELEPNHRAARKELDQAIAQRGR